MNAVTVTWRDLDDELAAWRAAGRVATLWWRDDDATVPGPALQRLIDQSVRWQVPLSLAVIPARASTQLRAVLQACPRVRVLQHGYAHTDHGNGAEPAAELGGHRPASMVLDELRQGRERLDAVLGGFTVPVLVPPWNRIDADLVAQLAPAGWRGVSCFSARKCYKGPGGLAIANCHVDPVHWKQGGVFRGESKCLSMLVNHLRARRLGEVDSEEPSGVLTHHWSHDEATWQFLHTLFGFVRSRDEVRWLDAAEVFDL